MKRKDVLRKMLSISSLFLFIMVVLYGCDENKNAEDPGPPYQIKPNWDDLYNEAVVGTNVDIDGSYTSIGECYLFVEIIIPGQSSPEFTDEISGVNTNYSFTYYSFNQWNPNHSTQYWIDQGIKDEFGNIKTKSSRFIEVQSAPRPNLEIWQGNDQFGNKYEVLSAYIAYRIQVRLKKENLPLVGRTITFKVTSTPSVNTTGYDLFFDEVVTNADGIAENVLQLGNEEGAYIVTATYVEDENSYDVVFTLECYTDDENSNLPTGHTHEKEAYPGIEIQGDVYMDSPDAVKDVKLEIDYYNGTVNITKQELKSALENYLPVILGTAGLNTIYMEGDGEIDGIDDEIDVMDHQLTRQRCKHYLREYRDYNDAIHIIIGKETDPLWVSAIGILIQYWDNGTGTVGEPGFNHDSCAHYASGHPTYTREYLDSSGIIIFGDELPATIGAGWGANHVQPLAVCIAHEIGHALGLTKHWDIPPDDKGVMDIVGDFNSSLYSDYNYFDKDTWVNGRLSGEWGLYLKHSNAMSTRRVIGINTIDYWNY
jgi:hypothetical protein